MIIKPYKYLFILIVAVLISCSKPPTGETGDVANGITNKVISVTGQQYWKDSKVLKWNFDNNHIHIWDRNRNLINVKWGDVEVYERLDTKEGVVFIKGIEETGDKKQKYLDKAYNYWGNDSYWLNPFWKFFEEGVQRKIVKQKDGSNALLITHTSGGKTPGDSFLWLLDDKGMPIAWKLWVSIIPIKGFEISWEDWITLPNGLKIATRHKSKFNEITIGDIKVGLTINEVFPEGDPFKLLLQKK